MRKSLPKNVGEIISESLSDILKRLPAELDKEHLAIGVLNILADTCLSDPPTDNEKFLCGVAAAAIVRLKELEKL